MCYIILLVSLNNILEKNVEFIHVVKWICNKLDVVKKFIELLVVCKNNKINPYYHIPSKILMNFVSMPVISNYIMTCVTHNI